MTMSSIAECAKVAISWLAPLKHMMKGWNTAIHASDSVKQVRLHSSFIRRRMQLADLCVAAQVVSWQVHLERSVAFDFDARRSK